MIDVPQFYIHIKDGERGYGADGRGVEARNLAAMLPLVRATVRDIVDDEGGPSMSEARVVEILDDRGEVVLTLSFVTAYGPH